MFERRERYLLRHSDPLAMGPLLYEAGMREAGVELRPLSPILFMGKSPVKGFGYVVKTTATATPMQGSFMLDLKVELELEDAGIGILIAGWVFCFPVGALLLLAMWIDFHGKRDRVMSATSAALQPYVLPPGAGAFGPWGPRG